MCWYILQASVIADIFGANRTKGAVRGKRGPSGKPGSVKDLCKWLRNLAKNILQKYEEGCCLLLDDLSHDIIRKGKEIAAWNSSSDKAKNLTAINTATNIIMLPDGKKAICKKQLSGTN